MPAGARLPAARRLVDAEAEEAQRRSQPPSRAAWVSVGLNALLSTALPAMLLAQAVVMTSPLLATLGLSLMIPLSVLADYARGLAATGW